MFLPKGFACTVNTERNNKFLRIFVKYFEVMGCSFCGNNFIIHSTYYIHIYICIYFLPGPCFVPLLCI